VADDGTNWSKAEIVAIAGPSSSMIGHCRIERLLGCGGACDLFLSYDAKLSAA